MKKTIVASIFVSAALFTTASNVSAGTPAKDIPIPGSGPEVPYAFDIPIPGSGPEVPYAFDIPIPGSGPEVPWLRLRRK